MLSTRPLYDKSLSLYGLPYWKYLSTTLKHFGFIYFAFKHNTKNCSGGGNDSMKTDKQAAWGVTQNALLHGLWCIPLAPEWAYSHYRLGGSEGNQSKWPVERLHHVIPTASAHVNVHMFTPNSQIKLCSWFISGCIGLSTCTLQTGCLI